MARLTFPFFIVMTLLFWLLAKHTAGSFPPILETAAEISGLMATIALAWNMVLSTRLPVFERIFQGLDKVILEHKRGGILAAVFVLAHPILFVLKSGISTSSLSLFFLPGTIAAFNWGIFAFWSLLIVLSANTLHKLPYQVWKRIHNLLAIPFILVFLHTFTIHSDVSDFLPLRIWIFVILGIGMISYIYKVFLYKFLGPVYPYRVKEVFVRGEIIDLTLTPEKKLIPFLAGQFAFLSIKDKRLGTEQHPFSFSSSPFEEEIRFSIKNLGDYTKRLKELKPGVRVCVYGPYGHMGPELAAHTKNVWIAGGIGVTPFLSYLKQAKQSGSKQTIDFFWSTKNQQEAVYDQEIKEEIEALPNFAYTPHISEEQGFLTPEMVAKNIPDVRERFFFLCGPTPMMKSFTKGLKRIGVPKSHIMSEDFSFR